MGQASRPTRRVTAPPHPAIQRPNCRARLEGAFPSPGGADNGRNINKLGRSFDGACRPGGRRGGWYDFIRRFDRRRPESAEHPNSVMPITLLDIIMLGVMLISGLLAMIRGFMREILSIAAWLIAAVVTLYFYAKLLPFAKSYFNNDIIAAAVVVGGTFLVTLLIVMKRPSGFAIPSRRNSNWAPASDRSMTQTGRTPISPRFPSTSICSRRGNRFWSSNCRAIPA